MLPADGGGLDTGRCGKPSPCGIEPEKLPQFAEHFEVLLPAQAKDPTARVSTELDSPRKQCADRHTEQFAYAPHDPLTPCASIPSRGNTAGNRPRGRHPAVRQSQQNVAEDPCTLQETELLTVAGLAARLKCSRSFIYRRLKPSHPHYIPHTRLTPSDVRFDGRVIADLLSQAKDASVDLGSTVLVGGKMTRNRDRKGSLLIKGRDRKCWVSQWPQGKKRPSKVLGWCDEMTRSQAERAHRQLMEKVNCQRDTVGDPITLGGFFHTHYWDEEAHEYRDELNTKKPSTRSDMKNTMLHILLPRWRRRKMDSIKTSEIQSFLASRIGEGTGNVSRKTALKWRNYLSSMFTAAIRLEVGVQHNPARGVKLPAAGREREPAYITVQQAIEILDQLQDPRHKMAWQLAVWLGNRCGVLRGLRWSSVNWEQNTITITESVWQGHSTLPKSQKGYRKVILTPNQIDVLRRYNE